MKNLFLCLAAAVVLFSCTKPTETATVEPAKYAEQYRPQYHFSPDHNWTNDPNGLVFYKGEYHLFYQYNPLGNKWGHMSWGHAVSEDLLHWKHLPVAIDEFSNGDGGDSTMIFSGSAVADVNNTSGFFAKDSSGIVAIYTSHVHRNNVQLMQHQSIASSADGRTFTRYEKNPVLDLQLKDFRDPKVIWYEPSKEWIMSAVIPDKFKVHFYSSKDLKAWKFLSEFGPAGDTAKIWECPDLVQVSMANDPSKKKWVLIISNSHPQGPDYVGMQYFIGNFDGKKFTNEGPAKPLYVDYGKDFYAAVTYNNTPGRNILLGWANNWAYGQVIPTNPWRSAMTLPRELYLYESPDGIRLLQKPAQELTELIGEEIKDLSTNGSRSILIEYELTPGQATKAGLKIFKDENEETILAYDAVKSEVYIDRTKSGETSFHNTFPSVERVPVRLIDGKLKLTIYIDQSIIEVFVNEGEQTMTEQIFPKGRSSAVEFFNEGEKPVITWTAWKMASVW